MKRSYNLQKTKTFAVRVRSYTQLDQIQQFFPCSTLENDGELILDCIHLEDSRESWWELCDILNLTRQARQPQADYLIFWK